jgi:prevent-host-death family protein
MTVFTIHQAKTNLSKLIAEVERGGEVVIARGKTPVAKLTPVEPAKKKVKRYAGMWKGRIGFDESFFDPLPADELALWNGEGD